MLTDYSFMAVMDVLFFGGFAESFIRQGKNIRGRTMGVFLAFNPISQKLKELNYET